MEVKTIEMRMMALAFALSLLIFADSALALPNLFSISPANNTYSSGGVKTLSVNITSSTLDTASARLHIRAQEEVIWDDYIMNCSSYAADSWYCYRSISLAIAGSDTKELFYFDANDTVGYNFSGLSNFIIDREPPIMTFASPSNNTFVFGNVTISLTVTDESSGVNISTVKYSLDNSTWVDTNVSGSTYTAYLNTTPFANNQSLKIYAIASDSIGNTELEDINVTVDNKPPSIAIVEPTSGTVTGVIKLQISASDDHSGVSRAAYSVSGISSSLDCSGSGTVQCEKYFNTANLGDGAHVLNLTVWDIAGNSNSSTVSITTINSFPTVSFTSPGTYAHGYTAITVSLTQATSVRLKIDSAWHNMTCSGTACSYAWNTTAYSDGSHQMLANISGLVGMSNASKAVIVDNKKPSLEINSPVSGTVNGTINPQVTITDEIGVSVSTIVFRITGSTYNGESAMACTEHVAGKKYFCSSSFNTTQIADDSYTLNFTAADLAGNYNSSFIAIRTVNGVNTTTATTSTTTTIPTTTTTSTTNPVAFTPITPIPSTTTTVLPFTDIGKTLGAALPIALAVAAVSLIVVGIVMLRMRARKNPWEASV